MALKFYQGEENGLVIEKKDYKSSIFYKQYIQALSVFYSTYKVLNTFKSDALMDSDISNVVAFCGDRGEGKTSCMKSFMEIVKSLQSEEANSLLADAKVTSDDFAKSKWTVLDSIDPALFDSKHNVLEIVLGLLYKQYLDFKQPEGEKLKVYEDVRHGFRKVRKYLHHLMDDMEQMYDMLDEMDNLASSITLRKEISDLFKNINILNGTTKIIVTIDDIDLNMTRAYAMSEQLRTFLNNQHCIVLMSCRVEQLQMVIAASLRDQMKADYVNEEIQAMAVKYVTKFLPVGNRINMPKVYDVANEMLSVYEARDDKKKLLENTVQMAVVELIFMKTRYLFYNSLGSVSPLIPNNLRSLRHLLGMLLRMDDFDNNEDHYENKRIFKNYFYYTWTRSLDDKQQAFISRISQYQNIISLNKTVVKYLSEHIDKTKLESDDTMRRILDGNNYVYNESVGDVFYVLNFLEQSVTDGQLQKMVFFLRSFYSIQLYERYDMLTEGKDEADRNTTRGTIYKADALLEKTCQLQRLINGSYFTYMPDELLPPSSEYGSRDSKVINGKLLTEFAKELEFQINAFNNGALGGLGAEETFKNRFRMLEFFALTIKRSIQSRNQPTYMHVDRDSATAQHISGFGMATLFVFDVMSLFSNIVNIRLAYNRFSGIESDKMYDFAKSQPWSLLNCMVDKALRKWCEESGEDYEVVKNWEWSKKKHRLLSNATIRNGEVLSAVFDQIKNKRYGYRSFKNSSDMLSKFYNNLIKSDMSTYDKADGKPYEMKFVFLEAINDYLNEPETDEFREIYEFKQGTSVRKSSKTSTTKTEKKV